MKRLLALLTLASSAHATGFSLVVHGVSHHFTSERFHEGNWGAGLRYDFTPSLAIQAGHYRNSYARGSTYLIADFTPLHVGRASAGIFGGTANGYPLHYGAFIPAGGAVIGYQFNRVALRVRYVPSVNHINKSVAALEASFKL